MIAGLANKMILKDVEFYITATAHNALSLTCFNKPFAFLDHQIC